MPVKPDRESVYAERWRRFMALQRRAFGCMSPEGRKRFIRRNMEKRVIPFPPDHFDPPAGAATTQKGMGNP